MMNKKYTLKPEKEAHLMKYNPSEMKRKKSILKKTSMYDNNMNTHEDEEISDELDTLENEYLVTLKKVVIMK